MKMQAKIVPWWRRALDYAFGGFRTGFGLFSRPAQTEPAAPLKENSLIDKPKESLEVETVLNDKPNPETLPAAAETVAAPTPAAEPAPAPAIAAELQPVDAIASEDAADTVDPVDINESADENPVEPSVEVAAKTVPVVSSTQPAEPPIAAAIEPTPELKQEIAHQAEPVAELDAQAEPVIEQEPESVHVAEILAAQNLIPAAVADPVPTTASASPIVTPAETPAATPTDPDPVPETPPTPKPFIKLESRDDEANLSPFSVVVEQIYDGPLDLLLDLIRKQDIDIYDIPIAIITAQFLAYVNQLKASDVDVAGDFIYIASLLIHIKSKMLLPRSPAGPEEAAEDPRRELVERLLEHERFKNAAQMLQQKQMLEAATWTNPGFREFQDDVAAEPEIAADTVDLVRIFRDILERVRSRPVFDVDEDAVTVGQMIQFLARRLTMEDKPVALRRLLSHTRSERALIAIFLALLELVRMQAILLRQDRAFSEIFVKKHTGFDAVMNEGLANAHDDWK
jgi:segregation and condensation protein A